ncbi:MAG: hypothetical protein GDA56_04405 [Hormoscilla sp. GM7CHS1pb]|nr:hypothetical protein [Hormoscilla sp. GM7CHS1pb]
MITLLLHSTPYVKPLFLIYLLHWTFALLPPVLSGVGQKLLVQHGENF